MLSPNRRALPRAALCRCSWAARVCTEGRPRREADSSITSSWIRAKMCSSSSAAPACTTWSSPVPGPAAGGDPAPEAHARPDPLAAGHGQHPEHLRQVPVEQDVHRRAVGSVSRATGRAARSGPGGARRRPAGRPPGAGSPRSAGPSRGLAAAGRTRGMTFPAPGGAGSGGEGLELGHQSSLVRAAATRDGAQLAICSTAHGLNTNGVRRAASVRSSHLTHFQSRTSSGFGSSGADGCSARAAKHRAHLVLLDATGIGGAVGEVGQHTLQVADVQAQLVVAAGAGWRPAGTRRGGGDHNTCSSIPRARWLCSGPGG